jgi:hypothetical protein
MELEGSLRCSQEPAIDPHPEPDESNPHPHTLYLCGGLNVFNITELKIKIKTWTWSPRGWEYQDSDLHGSDIM